MLPLPKVRALAAVADVLSLGSEVIVKEKKDARVRGEESKLVGNGQDIMSVLRVRKATWRVL